MKKGIVLIIILLFSSILIWNYNKNTDVITEDVKVKAISGKADQQSVAKKIIRLHILANSDSNEDQALKLKVRDKVLEYISPKLSNSKSIDESREILKKYDKDINDIAEKVIKENGYNYSVKTELSYTDFPVKLYGNIILPQGRYEAYRILIGNAKGHNWWCVMFPPLCFTDITKGNVEPKKTQEEMKSVLTKGEYELVDNSSNNNNSGNKSTSTAVDKNIKENDNKNDNKDINKSNSIDGNNSSSNNENSGRNDIKSKSKSVINKKNNDNKLQNNSIKNNQSKPINKSNNENRSSENITADNENTAQISTSNDNNVNNIGDEQKENKSEGNKKTSENNDKNIVNTADNQKIVVKFKLVDEFKKLGNILDKI